MTRGRRAGLGGRWAAVALLLLAAGLRFWRLGTPSVWYDEAYTWWVATQVSPGEALASSLAEFIPPGTYFLWRGWALLVGESELALRALAALLGVLAVAAGGRIARRLVAGRRTGAAERAAAWAGGLADPHAGARGGDGAPDRGRALGDTRVARRATLFALGLLAIAPPLLWAAREVRMYGPLLAFTLLGDMALLEVLRGPARHRRAWAWAWGALALAALYSVVLAGFWLIGLGAFTLAVLLLEGDPARRRGWVRALAGPALAAAALTLLWLVPALGRLGENRGYWPGTLPLPAFFARTVQGITVFRFLGSDTSAQRLGAALAAFALVAPVALMPVLVSASRRRMWRLADITILRTPLPPSGLRPFPRHLLPGLFLLTTTLPPLLIAGALFRTLPKWELQHTVIFAAPLYLTLATVGAQVTAPGLLPQRRREPSAAPGARLTAAMILWPIRVGMGLALVALALSAAVFLAQPEVAHDDWRGVTGYVAAHRAPGEVVIVVSGCAYPAWHYYAGGDAIVRLPDDPLLDVTHVLDYGSTAPVLNAALAGARGAWVVGYLETVSDPTDVVGTLLGTLGAEAAVPAFHGLTLRHFVFEPEAGAPDFPATPPVTLQPDAELLPGLRLWGVTLPPDVVPADRPLPIHTWWTVDDAAAHAGKVYQGSLRITDAAGNLWAQHDAPPGGGDYRPERWPVASPVLGRFDVPLLPGTPPGTYTATLMLYEVGGNGSGGQGPGPAVTLGALTVGRSTEPPPVPEQMVPATLQAGGADLTLLGVRLDTDTVRPCDTLSGRLFWEVAPQAGASARLPYRMELRVGTNAGVFRPVAGLSAGAAQPGGAWQPGDRFLSQFRLPIGCRAPDAVAPLEIALTLAGADPAGADQPLATWTGPEVTVDAGRVYTVPEEIVKAPAADFGADTFPAAFGGGVAHLLGVTLTPASAAGTVAEGEPFRVVLVWETGVLTETAYTAFVHVTPVDAPGPVVAQHDGWPALGERPTYAWAPDEVIVDPHPLAGLAPGTYALRAGLYGPDGTRLAVEGPAVEDDAVVVGTLTVR